MWFKNLQIYRFSEPFELDAESLNAVLADYPFTPCGSQDMSRCGWTPPLGRYAESLVHAANGFIMICLKRQDKLLPPAVVSEVLEDRVIEIEQREAQKLSRKARQELKGEIIFNLLPKAFARSSLHYAYIAPADGLLVVDAASANRSEELVSELRTALGSLGAIPLQVNKLPVDVMTNWLTARAADGFVVGEECELRDNADIRSIIRCKNQDLQSAEITGHLGAGMHVSKLALSWQDRLECVIDENLGIKRLRFSDIVREKTAEVEADDAAMQFDVDFSIMTLELAGFLKALIEVMGGEQ